MESCRGKCKNVLCLSLMLLIAFLIYSSQVNKVYAAAALNVTSGREGTKYTYDITITNLVVGQWFLFRLYHSRGAIDTSTITLAIYPGCDTNIDYQTCMPSHIVLYCPRVEVNAAGTWKATMKCEGLPGSVEIDEWATQVSQQGAVSSGVSDPVRGPVMQNATVGGTWVSIDTLGLLTPSIVLGSISFIVLPLAVIYVQWFRRKKSEIES